MLIVALGIAGCAAYFSIWGLSQLFAGASIAVIILFSFLETGKIVVTTALHRYWGRVNKSLKYFLTVCVIILMLVTSAGIYGFLSNAYQKTANKLEIHQGEISVLDNKKAIFEGGIKDNEKLIENKNKRLDQLANLRTRQENRIDAAKSNRSETANRSDIKNADKEIQKLTSDIDVLNVKNGVLSDSVGKYNTKVLELKANNSVSGEIGPLKYIAELTGVAMIKIVNYLILLLIFVFDPLAIALILMSNMVFKIDEEESIQPKIEIIDPIAYQATPLNEVINEGINEGVNEGVKIPDMIPISDSFQDAIMQVTTQDEEPIEEPVFLAEQFESEEDIIEEFVDEGVNDEIVEEEFEDEEFTDFFDSHEPIYVKQVEVKEESIIEEPIIEEVIEEPIIEEVIEEPIIEEEIKLYKQEPVVPNGKISVDDIKEIKQRNFSVPVPHPKVSGSNTIQKIDSNVNNNRFFFKRK